jgi:hypothetical protein
MTVVQEIIQNWKSLSIKDFNEYLLNNEKTLLRIEKEQIVDAFNNEPDCEGDGDRYYTENYTESYPELDGINNLLPQQEISDEEIKKAAIGMGIASSIATTYFIEGAEWYREQLKKEQ